MRLSDVVGAIATDNLGCLPDVEIERVTRAEIERSYPGADDYGDTQVEMFAVNCGFLKTRIIAYLPASKTWEVLTYDVGEPTYWSQFS